MGVLDLAGSLAQLAGSVDLPLAHPTDFPHEEVDPKQGGGGGTNPALIAGGVVLTLALTGGLVWVKERTRRAEASAALEGDADADADEQRARPAVEPGDDPRPREEPA
jgi:hypothetical protein